MKFIRIFLVSLCCSMLLAELGLGFKAFSARRQAVRVLQTVDAFRLGVTTKTQAEMELDRIGMKTTDEECSASVGTCQGIAFELANYPRPSAGIPESAIGFTVRRISLFRPASLVGNFYFYSDRLEAMGVRFSTERAGVDMTLTSTGKGEDEGSRWEHNSHDGSDTFVKILKSSQQQLDSLSSSGRLNLKCFESIKGCDTNDKLWMASPHL